jgi:type III secretion system FlhB-like substrate exporter
MSIKLANEIIDTANDIGNTIKKKKKLIKWLKQIKLLHILDINFLNYILAKSLK